MVRERLTGQATPAAAKKIVELWRPLIEDRAGLEQGLATYAQTYERTWGASMARKLGLSALDQVGDEPLVNDLFEGLKRVDETIGLRDLDDSGDVPAEHRRQVLGVATSAVLPVDGVHRCRVHLDEHLAVARLRAIDVLLAQDLRPSGLVDHDSVHGDLPRVRADLWFVS